MCLKAQLANSPVVKGTEHFQQFPLLERCCSLLSPTGAKHTFSAHVGEVSNATMVGQNPLSESFPIILTGGLQKRSLPTFALAAAVSLAQRPTLPGTLARHHAAVRREAHADTGGFPDAASFIIALPRVQGIYRHGRQRDVQWACTYLS